MRDFFFKDWAWKLFSLVLAVAIWFTVHRIVVESTIPKPSSDISTLTIGSLPVSLVSATKDVHNYRPLQPTISVTVSGPIEAIGKLQPNQLRATVDLSETNNISTEKQPVAVSAPPGVTVISIKPDSIGILPPP
ncbi:MAG TPA: hypothetical protein VFF11_13375 [Candidatus Binatia bacterium]|nr:hypothetical protein [Candidatus Binatia bacterium]